MFRSIRFRLALWYTLVLSLTFILISFTIYQYVRSTLSDSLDKSLVKEAEWVHARVERGMLRGELRQAVAEDLFEHASYFPLKEYVEVRDSTGALYYQSPNLSSDTLYSSVVLLGDTSEGLRSTASFRNHEIRLVLLRSATAMVLLGMPADSLTQPLRELLIVFAWIFPFVVLVGAVGGVFLARKSFAKINDVIEIAKNITADRLHDRIPAHDAQDEIGSIITTFNHMIARLDSSFERLRQFSADASHELRTPLSVIRVQLETALRGNASPSELREVSANCLDEAMRMSTIIDNLLLLARADAGQDVIKREPVDLQDLMREMYAESVIIASSKLISVTLRQVEAATIVGDEQRLRQMILNLIDNAVKYNRSKGEIHLSLVVEAQLANIRVQDTGIGILESEIPRIFDRFYRVDRARSREMGGSGLGLSISRWIVEAHGGEIRVSSRPNQGSEFLVSLPLAKRH